MRLAEFPARPLGSEIIMQSLDPYVVSPKEMQELIALHAFLDSSGLEESLIELLRVNVARLNGCTQGVRRHFRCACAIGESIARLRALGSWQDSLLFTEREGGWRSNGPRR